MHLPLHAPRPTIGVVGIGNMGLGMALRLRERGYPVRVHDLDPAREACRKAPRCMRMPRPWPVAARR